jgi:DNA modification methylase
MKGMEEYLNKIICGDCLEVMPNIPDKSVDMILCDLPYGTTACSWDVIIPLDKLWNNYNRIIKDNGIIVLTASQPFTSLVVTSNIKFFKHHWVWDKKRGVGHLLAKKRPMMVTEDILVFYKDLNERKSQLSSFVQLRNYFKELFLAIKSSKSEIMNKIGQRADHCFRYDSTQWDLPTEETYKQLISYFNIDKLSFFKNYEVIEKEYKEEELTFKDIVYNPQMRFRDKPRLSKMGKFTKTCYGDLKEFTGNVLTEKYPINLISFDKSNHRDMLLHPTQKPVALFEYLIKTYTNEGDLVLDNCIGSGTTAIACVNLKRNFIGIEKEPEYCKIAEERLKNLQQTLI